MLVLTGFLLCREFSYEFLKKQEILFNDLFNNLCNESNDLFDAMADNNSFKEWVMLSTEEAEDLFVDLADAFLDLRLRFEKPSKELCKAMFYYAGYLFIHKIFEISSDLSQLEIPADIVRLFKMPAFPEV